MGTSQTRDQNPKARLEGLDDHWKIFGPRSFKPASHQASEGRSSSLGQHLLQIQFALQSNLLVRFNVYSSIAHLSENVEHEKYTNVTQPKQRAYM